MGDAVQAHRPADTLSKTASRFQDSTSRLSFSASQYPAHGSKYVRRPHFIAEHARNARGLLGRVIAFIMARETWSQNLRVMDALGINQNDRISTSDAAMGAA
jgi:hypothetical protein